MTRRNSLSPSFLLLEGQSQLLNTLPPTLLRLWKNPSLRTEGESPSKLFSKIPSLLQLYLPLLLGKDFSLTPNPQRRKKGHLGSH